MVKFCCKKNEKFMLSEHEVINLINKYIHNMVVYILKATIDFDRMVTLEFVMDNKYLSNTVIVNINMLIDKETINSKDVYNTIEKSLYKITRFDFEHIYDRINVQDYGLKIDEFFIPNDVFSLIDFNSKFYVNESIYSMLLVPPQYIDDFITESEIDDIHDNLILLIDEIEDVIDVWKYPITIVLSGHNTYICSNTLRIEKIPISTHKLKDILSNKEWNEEKFKLVDFLLKHLYGLYDKDIRDVAMNKLKLQIL